jgi:hypothetical protein
MNDDDEFAKLSPEDRAKLALLEQEWERDGDAAIERFGEHDPGFMLRILECLDPKAVRDATENLLLDEGLTNADLRAMLDKALRERKH